MESPSTQARAKGTIWKIVKKMLPKVLMFSSGQRSDDSGAAHRPPMRANREAHFAPSADAV